MIHPTPETRLGVVAPQLKYQPSNSDSDCSGDKGKHPAWYWIRPPPPNSDGFSTFRGSQFYQRHKCRIDEKKNNVLQVMLVNLWGREHLKGFIEDWYSKFLQEKQWEWIPKESDWREGKPYGFQDGLSLRCLTRFSNWIYNTLSREDQ